MNATLTQVSRLMTRRTRSGQSIIIIAFAFIALIAFVGIATDVGMLFVRYSALRRAVDAAAIAAAGQVRQNADYMTMESIAMQFIQVHGIDPSSVKVETCETEIADYLAAHPLGHAATPTDIDNTRQTLIAAKSELCTDTPSKLVRVSAQIDSPTSFLRLVGWGSVRLSTSSLSQTAELDVALLLDTNRGEAADTSNAECAPDCSNVNTAYYEMGTPSTSVNYSNVRYNPGGTVGGIGNQVKGSDGTGYGGNGGICPHGADPAYAAAYSDNYPPVPPATLIINPGFNRTGECNNADALRFFRDFTNPSPTDTTSAPGGARSFSTIPGYATTNPRLPEDRWGVSLLAAPSSYITNTQYNPTTAAANGQDAFGQPQIRYECWYTPAETKSPNQRGNYGWAGCCNDPTIQSDFSNGQTYFDIADPGKLIDDPDNPGHMVPTYNTDPNWYVYDDSTLPESIINDRPPSDANAGTLNVTDPTTGVTTPYPGGVAKLVAGGRYWNEVGSQATYSARYGTQNQYSAGGHNNAFNIPGGAVSTYPFNRGDGNYSDLLCQPFKQVRDAARRFIERMDFVRGDRLVLVTFDSEARDITPYGDNIPIITDKNKAITALNMQVGVEVEGSHTQAVCSPYYAFSLGPDSGRVVDWMGQLVGGSDGANYAGYPVNSKGIMYPNPTVTNYFNATQCVDENTGGGILIATRDLTDARYIRRDAVWVMVTLSDGYPDRTPPQGQLGIGDRVRQNLTVCDGSTDCNGDIERPQVVPANTGTSADGSNPQVQLYCNPANLGTGQYGAEPQLCAMPIVNQPSGSPLSDNWGPRDIDPRSTTYTAPLTATDANSYWSQGFCPAWTFCNNGDSRPNYDSGGSPTVQCKTDPTDTVNNVNDVDATNWNWDDTKVFCVDNDPDSRHFCMNSSGVINATGDDYQCDKNYDAMDFAMDMADYAGLEDYTSKAKGNFIAMYSIYFKHSVDNPAANTLGVKFLRYMSDAGDNGVIDNAVQHWYRDMRDNVKNPKTLQFDNPSGDNPKNGVNPPPVGGNCVNPGGPACQDPSHITVLPSNPVTHLTAPNGVQFLDPSPYHVNNTAPCTSGSHPDYQSCYWDNFGLSNYVSVNADPCVSVETDYTQSCGQYFYASDVKSVNAAFLQIASRLFTRLSR